jgi:hypothetical protein
MTGMTVISTSTHHNDVGQVEHMPKEIMGIASAELKASRNNSLQIIGCKQRPCLLD